AEDRGGATTADGLPAVVGAERVGGVLDQRKTVTGGEQAERVEVDGLAGEVHGDDGPGASRDRARHGLRLDVEGPGVDVDEHRPGADGQHHVGRRGPGHGRGDDLVTWADARRQQRQVQARGPGRDGDCVRCSDGAGEGLLEAAHARPARQPARAQAGGDLFDLFRPDRRAREREKFGTHDGLCPFELAVQPCLMKCMGRFFRIACRPHHPPVALGAAVLLATACLYLQGLGRGPLLEPDEGRYAEIPREMLVTGDWVVPRLNGVVYAEKPPLVYWLTALSYRVVGVNELGARLV